MRREQVGEGELEHWSPQDLATAFENDDVLLIDLRSADAHAEGHIAGATSVPAASDLSDLDTGAIPDGRPVVFHCGTGNRSRRAALKLLEAGRAKAAHLEGGYKAWVAAGLPVVAQD